MEQKKAIATAHYVSIAPLKESVKMSILNITMGGKMIHYKDLSGWLKAIVVISWIMAGLYGVGFIVGFIAGMAGGW